MREFGIKKLYYSISEVSKITGLEQYILRYWETEFDKLKPAKNRAGNRIYTNKDIKLIFFIKKLLREQKYTIDGAKLILENYNGEDFDEVEIERTQNESRLENNKEQPSKNDSLKTDLEEIKKILTYILEKL